MSLRNVQEIYPLSPLQEGMLYQSLLLPADDVYVRQIHGLLRGPLDTAAFAAAWQRAVARHDVLRTGFLWQDLERPLQVVRDHATVAVEEEDWRGLDGAARHRRLEARLEADRRRGFDLTRPPLLRIALFREADDAHRFLLTVHHLVLDAWSRGLLLGEVFALYDGLRRGSAPALPPAVPFKRYLEWLGARNREEMEAFWRRELAGLPEPAPFPLTAGGAEVEGDTAALPEGRLELTLDAGATAALEELFRRHRLTLGSVVHGAWGVLLARYLGRRRVVLGSVVSGRPPDLPGVDRMVGMLINTLPLALEVDPRRPVAAWLEDLQLHLAELRRYQHSSLSDVQRWAGTGGQEALFDSVVVVENVPQEMSDTGGLRVSGVEVRDPTDYAVTLYVLPGERLALRLLTRGAGPPAARLLLSQLRRVLAAMVADTGAELGTITGLTPAQRHQLLVEWNDSAAEDVPPLGSRTTLHAALGAACQRFPDAVAVESAAGDLTYSELARRGRHLASELAAAGVGRGDRVALLADRTPDLLVALLGVLEAGAAFVPLDPAFPPARLRLMVEDSGTRRVLAARRHRPLCADWGVPVQPLGEPPPAGEVRPVAAGAACGGDDLAYVLYTSGSTGHPKGVQISHRAVLNFLSSMARRPGLSGGDVLAAVTTVSFDISVLELFLPLLAGARVALLDRATAGTGDLLLAALHRHRATVLQATPVTWRLLLDGGWQGDPPVTALCGGEALPASLAAELVRRADALWNVFGPTETTVWSSVARVTDPGDVSLGRPVANTTLYVVDRRLTPCPAGAAGELLIGGDGLARGYLGRGAATAERFVPDPFARQPGARLYRTGDLARHGTDGRLHFLGRMDQQVKVRGHRIEPGEVESLLEGEEAVSRAVVLARPDESGGAALAAYVVPADPGAPPAPAALRRRLAERLPGYMVPGAFVLLDELPLTPNGKVDRKALPEPGRDDLGHRYRAPRSATEERLAAIWKEILEVDRVGADDDFFALGGHSLMATRVVSRVRRAFDVEVPLAVVPSHPTVASLAAWIDATRRTGLGVERPPLPSAGTDTVTAPAPVSFAQQRLWFLHQLEPDSPFYNLPTAVRLEGHLEVGTLAAALAEVARRHDVLRSHFESVDGEPRPAVDPPPAPRLPVVDLAGLPQAVAEAAATPARRCLEAHPFDLGRGPLWRAVLFRQGPRHHLLSLVLHHVAGDGWSLGLLVREATAHYRDLAVGRRPSLAAPALRYADYARWERAWLRGEPLERLLAASRDALEGATEPLELPTDRPRGALQSHRGEVRTGRLGAAETAALRNLARERRTTLFGVLMAGFQALLHRYTGRRRFTVGFPVAHRTEAQLEDLVGLFVNTLVVAAEMAPDTLFADLLATVDRRLLAAHGRQDLPFERLVEALEPERDLARTPLFQVLLVLQNMPLGAAEVPGLKASAVEPASRVSRFDWSLFVHPAADGGLDLKLEYAADLFDATTSERALDHLGRLLTAVADGPERPVAELPLLAPAERHQVLREWGGARPAAPWDGGVLAGFADRVAAQPEAVAVEEGETTLTYAQLDRRSRVLAAELARRGSRRGDVVAVQVERSPRLAVAILAVLRCGAAYLPLDPRHPRRRRAFLLGDATVRCALVDAGSGDAGSADEELFDGLEVVRVDSTETRETAEPEPRGPSPEEHLSPHDLAYVLYTSGSTGRPKGVAMTHGALANLIAWQLRESPVGAGGRTLQFASATFDVSFQELFATWCAGGTLVLVDEELRRDLPALFDLVSRDIDRAFLPVVAFQQICEIARERRQPPRRLREVVTAGEALRITPAVEWTFRRKAGCRLHNQYGPTEAHVVSAHLLAGDAGGWPASPPIGRPLPGVRLWTVDSIPAPVPTGVAGELWIGGAAPARGYLGRPALTAERFVPDPFALRPGARAYRTGDLARFRADGELEFLGRMDHQVKVRGFRVELGEVEAVLGRHPAVARAVAVVRQGSAGGELAAYVVPAEDGVDGAGSLTPDALADFLSAEVPAPSVPTAWCILAELPLLPSGKVDRRSLPEPGGARERGAGAGRTPVEETLLAVFQEVLGQDSVGVEDDFFRHGGHSLTATKVVSRLRRAFGVEVPVKSLFEHPTVAALAPRVEAALGGGDATDSIEPQPRGDGLPLSFAQRRLWFLEQLDPGTAAYHLTTVARLEGELEVAVLGAVFDEIRRRHEALRTAFRDRDGTPVQVAVAPRRRGIALTDLSALAEATTRATAEAEAERLTATAAARPFDLGAGNLLRLRLLRLAPRDHRLVMVLHHIAADAWSMGVLRREVGAVYAAFLRGRPAPLPKLPVQYADFAAWQRRRVRGEVLERHLDHWRRELAGMEVLELPSDHPEGGRRRQRGGRLVRDLPPELAQRVRDVSRRLSATPFMTLLAAFTVLLGRFAGSEDVTVGADVANRNRAETEGLVGFFVNMLVLRTDLAGNPTFGALVERVRATTLGAYAHQDLPFERLVEELRPERSDSHSPLFSVVFNYDNATATAAAGADDLPGLTLSFEERERASVRFDLALLLRDDGERMSAVWLYDAGRFETATVERLDRRFQRLLEDATADPDARLSRLGRADRDDGEGADRASRRRALLTARPKAVTLEPPPPETG